MPYRSSTRIVLYALAKRNRPTQDRFGLGPFESRLFRSLAVTLMRFCYEFITSSLWKLIADTFFCGLPRSYWNHNTLCILASRHLPRFPSCKLCNMLSASILFATRIEPVERFHQAFANSQCSVGRIQDSSGGSIPPQPRAVYQLLDLIEQHSQKIGIH